MWHLCLGHFIHLYRLSEAYIYCIIQYPSVGMSNCGHSERLNLVCRTEKGQKLQVWNEAMQRRLQPEKPLMSSGGQHLAFHKPIKDAKTETLNSCPSFTACGYKQEGWIHHRRVQLTQNASFLQNLKFNTQMLLKVIVCFIHLDF